MVLPSNIENVSIFNVIFYTLKKPCWSLLKWLLFNDIKLGARILILAFFVVLCSHFDIIFDKLPKLKISYHSAQIERQTFTDSSIHKAECNCTNNQIGQGGIQQLRGQNFAIFCPPPPAWTVFIPWAWTKTDIVWPPPTLILST